MGMGGMAMGAGAGLLGGMMIGSVSFVLFSPRLRVDST